LMGISLKAISAQVIEFEFVLFLQELP